MIKFDEQNKLKKPLNFKQYFSEMDLDEEEQVAREEFSRKYWDILLFIFALFEQMNETDSVDSNYLKNTLEGQIQALCEDIFVSPFADTNLPRIIANDVIDITIKHSGEAYFTSKERASILAVNASNSLANSKDFKIAYNNGYTQKKWVTEHDLKVRQSHVEARGQIVDINEPFVVGDSLLMFPGDYSLGAGSEEIANCRCTVEYF